METMIQWVLIIVVALLVMKRFLPVKGVNHISTGEAKEQSNNKSIQFIDVRTPNEYKSHHQKPFKNIPLSQLPSRSKELNREKEVMVICQSGMRSMKAAKILKKQGFNNIINVKGGMSAWN